MPTSEKQLFCHLHKKASCKYVDDIDARLQIDKVGQLNIELLLHYWVSLKQLKSCNLKRIPKTQSPFCLLKTPLFFNVPTLHSCPILWVHLSGAPTTILTFKYSNSIFGHILLCRITKTFNLMLKKSGAFFYSTDSLGIFLWPGSVSRWFSIRILLIGKMELDFPTPESNSPF